MGQSSLSSYGAGEPEEPFLPSNADQLVEYLDGDSDDYEQIKLYEHPDQGLGEYTRSRREELGMTQRELAEQISAGDRNHVSNWEREVTMPQEYLEVAEVLGIDPRWFQDKKNGNGGISNFVEGGLSDSAIEVVEGGLLGDGSLSKADGHAPQYTQASMDRRYVSWLKDELGDHGIAASALREDEKKWNNTHTLKTLCYPEFEELEERWYDDIDDVLDELDDEDELERIKKREGQGHDRVKRVPDDLEMTPEKLLHLHLGDGSLLRQEGTGRGSGRPWVTLYVNGFLREDIENIADALDEQGIDTAIHKNKDDYALKVLQDDVADYYSFLPDTPEDLEDVESSKGYEFSKKWPQYDDKLKMVAKWDGVHDLIQEHRLNHEIKTNDFSDVIGYGSNGISKVEDESKPQFDTFQTIVDELEIDIEGAWNEMKGGTRQSRFHVTEDNRFNVNWRGETLGLPLTPENASELVPEMRDETGLSQRALAERTDVSRTGVQGIEYGKTTPTRWTLKKLARGLAD